MRVSVRRLGDGPIIHSGLDPGIGTNINGPSLLRVPEWVDDPLGRYYLYFADHKGAYIRLAFADALAGPWRVHPPGALHLRDTPYLQTHPEIPESIDADALATPRGSGVPSLLDDCVIPHIASPEVAIDSEARRLHLYYHGLASFGRQITRAATSTDGLHWSCGDEILGNPYLRVFRFGGWWYGLAMPGIFYRSRDGLTDFETGPRRFEPDMRHAAVLVRKEQLLVFWTRVGDTPERIWLSTLDLRSDWSEWRESEPTEILRPELPWEGAERPLEPSVRSSVTGPANQLRDPAIHCEGDSVHLLYVGGGESAIGISELELDD